MGVCGQPASSPGTVHYGSVLYWYSLCTVCGGTWSTKQAIHLVWIKLLRGLKMWGPPAGHSLSITLNKLYHKLDEISCWFQWVCAFQGYERWVVWIWNRTAMHYDSIWASPRFKSPRRNLLFRSCIRTIVSSWPIKKARNMGLWRWIVESLKGEIYTIIFIINITCFQATERSEIYRIKFHIIPIVFHGVQIWKRFSLSYQKLLQNQ